MTDKIKAEYRNANGGFSFVGLNFIHGRLLAQREGSGLVVQVKGRSAPEQGCAWLVCTPYWCVNAEVVFTTTNWPLQIFWFHLLSRIWTLDPPACSHTYG